MQMWTIWMQCAFDCVPFASIVRLTLWIDEFDIITGNELKYRHFGISVTVTAPQWKKIYAANGNKFAETSSWNWKYSNILANYFLSKMFKEKEACPHGDLKFLFQQKMSSKPRCSHSGFIVCAVQKQCLYLVMYLSQLQQACYMVCYTYITVTFMHYTTLFSQF